MNEGSKKIVRMEAALDQKLAAMRNAGEGLQELKLSLSEDQFNQWCMENGYSLPMVELLIHIAEFGLTSFAASRLIEMAEGQK